MTIKHKKFNKLPKQFNKLPKQFHFLKNITPHNAEFLEYLDDESIDILLGILNDIIHQRIELNPTDLHKVEPIIKKHKILKKNFTRLNIHYLSLGSIAD